MGRKPKPASTVTARAMRGGATEMATRARNPAKNAATTLPFDVRAMNLVASLVFALAALALLAALIAWLLRAPLFTLRSIALDGELARSNLATLRANALPRLAGNFFSVDLERARGFCIGALGAPGGGAPGLAEWLGRHTRRAPRRGPVARRARQ